MLGWSGEGHENLVLECPVTEQGSNRDLASVHWEFWSLKPQHVILKVAVGGIQYGAYFVQISLVQYIQQLHSRWEPLCP
jgi:hypothetical protein